MKKTTANLVDAFERGELRPSKNRKLAIKAARTAAENHVAKNAQINLRVPETLLMRLKRRAAEEGLPYQTMITSILHKFITGRLCEHN